MKSTNGMDRALSQALDERDHMEEEGTRLANAVGEFLGVDVGEWSSANSPIRSAIEALESIVPAQAAELTAISEHDLCTSDGGRGYVAEFFEKRLRNRHYRRYIEEYLAADFACALARYLSEHDAATRRPATSPSAEG